jgi:predicted DNA-binding protein
VWAQPTIAERRGASRLTVSRPSKICDFVRRKEQNEGNMSDNSKSQFTNRLTVHITGAMDNRLEQIASQRDEAKAEVVRAALRAYLDEQEDLIGSRKHFTKAFQRRMDYIEFMLTAVLWMVGSSWSLVHTQLAQEEYPAGELMQDAIAAARQDSDLLHRLLTEALLQKSGKHEPPAE